jgi:hypothetical protein
MVFREGCRLSMLILMVSVYEWCRLTAYLILRSVVHLWIAGSGEGG